MSKGLKFPKRSKLPKGSKVPKGPKVIKQVTHDSNRAIGFRGNLKEFEGVSDGVSEKLWNGVEITQISFWRSIYLIVCGVLCLMRKTDTLRGSWSRISLTNALNMIPVFPSNVIRSPLFYMNNGKQLVSQP